MIILGCEYRDRVSGFKGIAVAKTEWLNGCARINLQPKVGKDGKVPDSYTFDEPQLDKIGTGIKRKYSANTGGPLPFKPEQHKGAVR
jgi:hypothetical protein